ncbi:hypothetical protein AGLY_006726, partial [Aphis glycines]
LKNIKLLSSILILQNLYFLEYFAGITDNGCPTDSHFLCSDNMTCIPYHHVCDISPDCPDETDETENCFLVPTEARCTFESGFCGWRNASGEMSLTWKLYKGDRHKFTGPKWDNTFRNRTGTYAYVDMSGSSYLGATARMDSIHFHPPPTYCSDTESKYYNSCYVSIHCIPITIYYRSRKLFSVRGFIAD